LKTFHEPFASNQLGYLLIFFIGDYRRSEKPAATKRRIRLWDLTLVMSRCSDRKLPLIKLTSID